MKDTGFEDMPTVQQDRSGLLQAVPPPLPFQLTREKEHVDEDWMLDLPDAALRVLSEAKKPAPNWPLAPRIPGAVAVPRQAIPSLRRHAG